METSAQGGRALEAGTGAIEHRHRDVMTVPAQAAGEMHELALGATAVEGPDEADDPHGRPASGARVAAAHLTRIAATTQPSHTSNTCFWMPTTPRSSLRWA